MRRVLIIPALLAAGGLAAAPAGAQRLEQLRLDRGMARTVIDGGHYKHLLLSQGPVRSGLRLYVFIDGDGTPARRRSNLAAIPQPEDSVVLRLMARHAGPALLLGRPCYHGVNRRRACDESLWSTHRYSREVVDSMIAALRAFLAPLPETPVTLVGFSGGGVLAMMMATHVPGVDSVVTMAANLDTEAWRAHHGQPPLSGSLNPADFAPLPPRIAQLHLAGGEDKVVPAALIRPEAQRQPTAHFGIAPGVAHLCCWETLWPVLLDDLPWPEP